MPETAIEIRELMAQSGVKFGTSGARGLAEDMRDGVCYAYTAGFIQYLEQIGDIAPGTRIAVGGDLRPSTGRIMAAAGKAIADRGYTPEDCGRLPSPALALYGLSEKIPTVMVTGSHIPEDRNGIKYTKCQGEILKQDEAGMIRQTVVVPEGLFDAGGNLLSAPPPMQTQSAACERYIARYLDCFGPDALKGQKIGVYQHSAVGRDLMVTILQGLGAQTTPLGFSDVFIPVDTEAIRPEDVEMAATWTRENHFDAILSTDGDSDRPLVSDEMGKWLRGDVAGVLCAGFLAADAVVTPVSCNSLVDKCGWFKSVQRTRIGSPYVIEGMQQKAAQGFRRVTGYEANGGFLIQTDLEIDGRTLTALPTRDALIVQIAILSLATQKQVPISGLLADLPRRFTYSDRLKNFPTQASRQKLAELGSGVDAGDFRAIETALGRHFGKVAQVDQTDGLRITFENQEVVHLRPSGNAPEFRCYNEADSEERAVEMNRICMQVMENWR